MNQFWQKAEKYLWETLGIEVTLESWPGKSTLPLYLRQGLEFAVFRIFDRKVLAAIATKQEPFSPIELRNHFEQFRSRFDGDLVYVCDHMDAYQRKRLVEQKVPFVVPGNQLYLPTLGIDFRDHFRKAPNTRDSRNQLSPLAQLAYLYVLYHPEVLPISSASLASKLACSKMSMSRAYAELQGFELIHIVESGRSREMSLHGSPRECWDRGMNFMKSPVKKRIYFSVWWSPDPDELIAGRSALALHSNLSSGQKRIFAVGPSQGKKLQEDFVHMTLPDRLMNEAIAVVEVWSYEPHLLSTGKGVDPLSLYLSIRGDPDERVEASLTELLGGVRW